MNSLNVVGRSITKVDGKNKLDGRAIYPQDIYIEGMLFGTTVRSTKPHAFINIDITEAQKVDGVVKILTYSDVPGKNHHGVVLKDHEVFASKKVRRIGDPIAFVIAKTKEIAEYAAKLVKVEYDELPAVFDAEDAMKPESPKVQDRDNLFYHFKIRRGDVDIAFKECDVIVENVYKVPMVDHAFLQPEAGVSYIDEQGRIVVIASTQYPHFDQEEIAESLGVEKDRVRVVNPTVGGAFGGREDITLQIHLAIAAYLTKKPVKVVYSREESFVAHSKRHSMKMYYKTGATKDGRLLALEARIIGDSGAYASWAMNVLRKSAVHATGPYEIPNVKVDSYAVYTNNPFTGAMRGFGATQVAIAYEQQMDILAEKLGISPIDIRLKNAFRVGSITATGQVLNEGVKAVECIEAIKD
ncbi:Nicotinate dehydrogenase large molybdopterin subunit [Caloramator mitchellensis]|uniref:Nicotinate dehydrogenase large molybdopterin subunit n=1 Tax=Caloramator mitchellensis TaxID=908809 RepID=A0A0R3JVH1_CALMK|nr:molybdopterin cofactor-binding domain-containing protein [Caloramator mitchellensis]KRQ87575.1 Nicotinate dehydrogenase large molybdopterin subunit [Caloramator mitchellensis]